MFNKNRFESFTEFLAWYRAGGRDASAIPSHCSKCLLSLWMMECGESQPWVGLSWYGSDATPEMEEQTQWMNTIRRAFDEVGIEGVDHRIETILKELSR